MQRYNENPRAMKKSILVPDIGDFKSVEIIEVLVAPGDSVNAEDALLTLESDKATMEVPSPEAGVIAAVKVKVGDKISQGDIIAELETAESNAADKTESPPTPPAESPPPPPEKSAEILELPTRESPPPTTPSAATTQPQSFPGAHASPAVRKIAREFGVDLTQVNGGGRKGRILKEDVQNFVKNELSRKPISAEGGSGLPLPPTVDFSKFGEIEKKPRSRINKLSAANLSRNWILAPHVTQFDDADITEMEAFRKSLADDAAKRGVKMTPLAFLIKAAVASLREFPQFNSSLDSDGEHLIVRRFYHIGFAADTPSGLVVPVIRDADKKGLLDLAAELSELSGRAREGKLKLDEMQGGCFTISSLGGIGGTQFTPIINLPEAAILGVSRAKMSPVWNGKEFIPRLLLPLSLSYDHRIIDGAQGARFITFLSRQLADIRRLML